jgi:hypothetical protein
LRANGHASPTDGVQGQQRLSNSRLTITQGATGMPAMSAGSAPPDGTRWLLPGTRVQVRNRFDAAWAVDFEVVEGGPDGYRVRRLRDRRVLPALFPFADVRVVD